MPTVNCPRDFLFKEIGRSYTEEEFDELCFEFGIELDDVTTNAREEAKERGETVNDDGEEIIYKIDVPANRYDLLCVEGLARALRVFLGMEKYPQFKTVKAENPQKLVVRPDTKRIRPFVVGAVLRGVTFNPERYQSFIDLQEKLHQNLCRKRSLVAIGTHDLDTIQGPFTYDALAPEDIEFVPLNQQQSFKAPALMQFYEKDSHLRHYLPIIRDSPVYPVIKDANGIVLSLPPIINGNHSKITMATKNVFIECTATDLTKAKVVVDTMVTMFSQYCAEPFTIEEIDVETADGTIEHYPPLMTRTVNTKVSRINETIGIQLDGEKAAELLTKMSLTATYDKDTETVASDIPPTRSDILHDVDVAEDIAIAYGYNNIKKTVPQCHTVAKQLPINKLADSLRRELAQSGFTEALTFGLCSHKESFEYLRQTDDSIAVVLANPKTIEFEVCRVSLLSGLLKTLGYNKGNPLPIKLFEVSDVVLKDSTTDTGARNEKRLCAIYCDTTSGFETIHGLVDRVMRMLDYRFNKAENPKGKKTYAIKPSTSKLLVISFFPLASYVEYCACVLSRNAYVCSLLRFGLV